MFCAVLHRKVEDNAAAFHILMAGKITSPALADQAYHALPFLWGKLPVLLLSLLGHGHQRNRCYVILRQIFGPCQRLGHGGRVCAKAGRANQAGQQGQDDNSGSRLLAAHDIADTLFGIPFPKRKRDARNPLPSNCKAQEGFRIFCTDIIPHSLHHCFITAHFHVFHGQGKGQPYQRIHPVQAHSKESQQLYQAVPPADMVLLMKDQVAAFLFADG